MPLPRDQPRHTPDHEFLSRPGRRRRTEDIEVDPVGDGDHGPRTAVDVIPKEVGDGHVNVDGTGA